MKPLCNLVLALLTLIALSACSSAPPTRYFLLEADAAAIAADDGITLGLHPVEIPEYLQRTRLLLDASGGSLAYSNNSRWSEPLADAIYRVSQLQLAQQLSTGNFSRWPWSPDARPDWEVRISVLAMECRAGQCLLTAEIGLRQSAEELQPWQRLIRTWRASPENNDEGAIAASYGALVRSMNRDIADLIRDSD
jgi:uncharacterized lipoprotein YmbA